MQMKKILIFAVLALVSLQAAAQVEYKASRFGIKSNGLIDNKGLSTYVGISECIRNNRILLRESTEIVCQLIKLNLCRFLCQCSC